MARSPTSVKVRERRNRKMSFLEEIAMFFEGKSPVHKTMVRVAKQIEKAGICYVIVGGMAVHAQGYHRTTDDLDPLLTRQGFQQFKKTIVPLGYDPVPGRPKRFIDTKNNVTIDILITGLYPGRGDPGPISYPDPVDVREIRDKLFILNLPTLIQLKLAARRHQDFADVVELIRANQLDESFLNKLHPTLHRDFIECLEEKRREDEYETRQDQAVAELLNEPYPSEEE